MTMPRASHLALAALLLSSAWSPSAAHADADYDRWVAKGNELVKARKWPKAISAFEQADAIGDGCDLRCLLPWSVALERHHRYGDAVEVLARAAALDPADRSLLERFLQSVDRRLQAHRGIRPLRDFLATVPPEDPARLWAENELGVRLVTAPNAGPDQFRQAERAFARALESHPGSAIARINLAQVQDRQERAIDAMATLDALPEVRDFVARDGATGEAAAGREAAILRQLPLSLVVAERVEARGFSAPGIERMRVRPASDVGRPEGFERPKVITRPLPQYTEEARKARITGVVIMKLTIDERGRVTDVAVTRGLPMGLTEKAVEAAYAMRFEPATVYGTPIATTYDITTSFRLQ